MTGLLTSDNFEVLEGRRCGLIEGLSRFVPGSTEENHEYGS